MTAYTPGACMTHCFKGVAVLFCKYTSVLGMFVWAPCHESVSCWRACLPVLTVGHALFLQGLAA